MATAKKSATKKSTPAGKAKAAPKAKSSAKRASSKRELIKTGTDKRYVRRSGKGTFKESDDVSRSLSADRPKKAKTAAKRGQGDKGDRSSRKA